MHPALQGYVLTSCCTPATRALALYMPTPQCHLQPNKYDKFQKALKSSKAEHNIKTNLPKPIGATTRIKNHQDVKTEVLCGNFNKNTRSAENLIQPLVTSPGTSPCGGLRLGSTPWPAMASHLVQASASLQGHHGQPPRWDGSA